MLFVESQVFVAGITQLIADHKRADEENDGCHELEDNEGMPEISSFDTGLEFSLNDIDRLV